MTATPSATRTASPTATRTASPTPSRTASPTASRTASQSPTRTPTPISGLALACGTSFTIDGRHVDAPWNTGAWTALSNVTVPTLGLGASARLKVYYDANNLYVAMAVSKTPGTLFAGPTLWQNDSMELYFDMGNNGAATYDANDYHFTFGWNNPTPQGGAGDSVADIQYGSFNTGNGWTAEMAIPWANLGVAPGTGTIYGFDAAVNVASATDTRQCQLTWNATFGDNYQNTSQFGDLVVGAACPYFSPTASPTRTPTSAVLPSATPTRTNTPVTRGATVPFITHEAENGVTNGTLLGPSRTLHTIENESSGRRAVRLGATGQYVRITAGPAANAIVVRYSIPDAAGGGGIDRTLSLYIDGVFRQKLNVTSRYNWAYGGFAIPYNQNPGGGSPLYHYDEVRALVGTINAGATVELRKDADDTAATYTIDLIELEDVAPALAAPANSLSAASYGAVPNDAGDDTTALQNLINAAQAQGRIAYIPAGTYQISSPLSVPAVAIQGAGMWHTVIHQNSGTQSAFRINAGNGSFFIGDLALNGEVRNRVDSDTASGLDYHGGNGSTLARVWIEHFKCAWWVGNNGTVTNNLTITGCRFRNLYADAINFCNGTSNSRVTNTHTRNTGDDALASWSPAGQGVNSNNLFSFNTVQLPWRANGIAIYGGSNNRIEDNLVTDTSNYPGIMVAQEFTSNALTSASVLRNTLTRAGGPYGGNNHGAFKISTAQGAVSNITATDLSIQDSTYAGIYLAGGNAINSSTFSNIQINTCGTWGIQTTTGTGGTINCTNVVVTGAASGGLTNPGGLNFVRVSGNTGW